VTESPWWNRHEIIFLASAIGSTNAEATISFFPRTPGNSTLHLGEKRRERAKMIDEIVAETTPTRNWNMNKNKARALMFLSLYPWRRSLLNRFFKRPVFDNPVTSQCEVRTLSDTIQRQALEHVDLLKIDIEGAELEALDGIEEQHWRRIRQLVMEISPAHKGALTALSDRLRAIGFSKVTVESIVGGAPVLDDPWPCMLYAVRVPWQQ
jgi:hypothetical protein